MIRNLSRRKFSSSLAMSLAGLPLLHNARLSADEFSASEIAPFRTPYKYGKLVLAASDDPNAFDCKSVDDPFVFLHEGTFYMLYIGFDGDRLPDRPGKIRRPDALGARCLRGASRSQLEIHALQHRTQLHRAGKRPDFKGATEKVHGRYLGAWNAYPGAGYETGAAVIGLAWSSDLLHWELTDPILFPADGAPWEHGGLYRPNLIEQDGVFYLYYNAKTDVLPKSEGGGWHEQSGVAISRDLKQWTRYEGNPILRNGGADSWDARFASNPFVVRHKNLWGMYYFGLDRRGVARELLALGRDAYHFEKVNEIMIDRGAPGTVDEDYAHKPCVLFHDGALYHFYCAVSGKWPHDVRGISVARSKPW